MIDPIICMACNLADICILYIVFIGIVDLILTKLSYLTVAVIDNLTLTYKPRDIALYPFSNFDLFLYLYLT